MRRNEQRAQYILQLHRLPIERPGREDIPLLCPHLSEAQGATLFGRMQRREDGHFAVPALLVRGAFHMLWFSSNDAVDGVPRLRLAFSKRSRPALEEDGVRGGGEAEYEFEREAVTYALAHWGEALLPDEWVEYGRVHLCDPVARDSRNVPLVKTVHVAQGRTWGELINDRSLPMAQAWDASLWHLTQDPFEGAELAGPRAGYQNWHCGYCGEGLASITCERCGRVYPHIPSSWPVALPRAVRAFVEANGYRFGLAQD